MTTAGPAAPASLASRISGAFRGHWLLWLGLGSLIGIVIAVDPRQLGSTLGQAQPVFLVLMAPAVVASYAARGLGWRVALRRVGVPISARRAMRVMIAGQMLIFLPAGDLGRVALVRETGGTRHALGRIGGTIVFQELTFMAVTGLAAIPIVAVQRRYVAAVVMLLALLALILVLLLWEPAFRRALRQARRIPRVSHGLDEVELLRESFVDCCRAPRVVAAVAMWSAVATAAGLVAFELALRAVGVDQLGQADIAFVYALGHVIAAVSMIPGGVGAYEATVTELLALRGVSPALGAAAALLYRAANDVFMALLGAVAAVGLRRRRSRGRQAALRAHLRTLHR